MSLADDVVRYFELTGEAPRPTPFQRFPTEREKRERGRELLRRLLTPEQRREFDRYGSWRVMFHERGTNLPLHWLEFGLAVQGFFVFDVYGLPEQTRNAEFHDGSQSDYCPEDVLLAVWLRFRRNPHVFFDKCCKSSIHRSDWPGILRRTVHLHYVMKE